MRQAFLSFSLLLPVNSTFPSMLLRLRLCKCVRVRDCVCVIDVPIEADLLIKNLLSFWTPLAVNHCLQCYIVGHTPTHLWPFPTPPCTSAYTLQRGSVHWSRHCIDKLINSILPSCCEEELNLFCLADPTEGCCECVVLAYVCVCIFSLLCFNLKQFLIAVISHNTVCDI